MNFKLKKISGTEWMGNGFGTRSAEWSIVGFDGYVLRGSTGSWSVFNPDRRRVVTGHSRDQAAELFVQVMADRAEIFVKKMQVENSIPDGD